MLRRNGPVVKSVESVLRLEGSLWGGKICERAAHNHALRTNVIKMKIDKQEGAVRCRMYKDREEASECSKMA